MLRSACGSMTSWKRTMVTYLAMMLVLIQLEFAVVQGDSISVDQLCFQVGDRVAVAFQNDGDDHDNNHFGDWLGIIATTNDNILQAGNELPNAGPRAWQWTCGSGQEPCRRGELHPASGSLVFSPGDDTMGGTPLGVGSYQAVLSDTEDVRDEDSPDFMADAVSAVFVIQNDPCPISSDGNAADGRGGQEEVGIEEEEEEAAVGEEDAVLEEDEVVVEEVLEEDDDGAEEDDGTTAPPPPPPTLPPPPPTLPPTSPKDVSIDSISVSKTCIEMEDNELKVTFSRENDGNIRDWIGIYDAAQLNDAALTNLNRIPEMWTWAACGGQTCELGPVVSQGEMTFSGQNNDDTSARQNWPLRPGRYQAVLSTGTEAPYVALAVSEVFRVDCSLPEANVIQAARNDIEQIFAQDITIGPKVLRLAFHDCVGGCDGCVDMTNPDNAGLRPPISALASTVTKFEPRGLSRTDVWMLAATVASDRAETDTNTPFPFSWAGRKTCADLAGTSNNEGSGGPCGVNFRGDDATCTATTGPHRELCHATSGTTTIKDFFEREFQFNVQQVAAIMGAHTLGKMNRDVLGFDGPAGWDLSNDDLDHGYYLELLGSATVPTPDWQLVMVDNSDLHAENSDIPAQRAQWEAVVDGIRLVMLHSDMAMVRQLEEGVNLLGEEDNFRVTCDFQGNDNPCPIATEFFPSMQRYSRSQEGFVRDYRDALELMTANGYTMNVGGCPGGNVCRLIPR